MRPLKGLGAPLPCLSSPAWLPCRSEGQVGSWRVPGSCILDMGVHGAKPSAVSFMDPRPRTNLLPTPCSSMELGDTVRVTLGWGAAASCMGSGVQVRKQVLQSRPAPSITPNPEGFRRARACPPCPPPGAGDEGYFAALTVAQVGRTGSQSLASAWGTLFPQLHTWAEPWRG